MNELPVESGRKVSLSDVVGKGDYRFRNPTTWEDEGNEFG